VAALKKRKKTLIFDREKFRYQAFISDIAGQDIHAHGGEVVTLIDQVASWLREEARDPKVPGGRAIAAEFSRFIGELAVIAATKRLEVSELRFPDFRDIAAGWILAERGAS
jgi:hypothetical protein